MSCATVMSTGAVVTCDSFNVTPSIADVSVFEADVTGRLLIVTSAFSAGCVSVIALPAPL